MSPAVVDRVVAAIFLLGVCAAPALAVSPPGEVSGEPAPHPRFDSRWASSADRAAAVLREPTVEQEAAADAFRDRWPGLQLRWDGLSGSPGWIAAAAGSTLSAPVQAPPRSAARAFLERHRALVGLSPSAMEQLEITDAVPGAGGGAHVYFVQRSAGLEVVGGRVTVNLDRQGAVRSFGTRLFAGVEPPGPPRLTAHEALRIAAADVYPDLVLLGSDGTTEDGPEALTTFHEPALDGPALARLVLFPRATDALLAWEVRLAEPGRFTDYRVLVDAASGELLLRENATVYADARVVRSAYPRPEAEELAPLDYDLVTLPDVTPQSPAGWISGSGTELSGNNATSHLGYHTLPGLSDPAALYDFPFNTTSSALATAWYYANDAHDRFYAAGFDEARGNYQQDNFGLGGAGGDPMGVVAWKGGGRNNAFLSVSVDGEPGTVNFLWAGCSLCADHDGYPENGGERNVAYDVNVVYHEYTHGVTTRMAGGPSDTTCLRGTQSGAMGEAWSDLFAASFLEDPRSGPYFIEGRGMIRRGDDSFDYGDLCALGDRGCAVHDDGLIFASFLWSVRESFRALDPVEGVEGFHRLVVESLASLPCHPTMLDGRDALLDADTALFGGTHHALIWNAAARHGMGETASTTGDDDSSPVADFTVPAAHTCTPPPAPTGLVAMPQGDNAVELIYEATGAEAVEIWRDDRDNPLAGARRVGVTTDLATYLDEGVEADQRLRYHLVALGRGGETCRSAESATDEVIATGTCRAHPVFDGNVELGEDGCQLVLSWSPATLRCPSSPDPVVYDVYRSPIPGFNPSPARWLARTTDTSITLSPPQSSIPFYYLVTAAQADPDEAPDHLHRGDAQIATWVGRHPTTGRAPVHLWDFESGTQGWTADLLPGDRGGWARVRPHGTHYGGLPSAPDAAAGGSGYAWVTGDAGGPSDPHEFDCDNGAALTSPLWDATSGATLLSFDYWAAIPGGLLGYLWVEIDNGSEAASTYPVWLRTVPDFDTDAVHGWQRAEIDIARYVTPTTTTRVSFRSQCGNPISEFGIDNVRVEAGTVCARSALELDSVTVDDTPAGWGNGNGLLEPGETARLSFVLRNDGDNDALQPVGTLSSGARGVLVHEDTAVFPDIPAGGTASSGDEYTVSVPAAADCADTVYFMLGVTDADGVLSRIVWTPEYGTGEAELVFTDDFESDQGWLSEMAGPNQGTWQRGTPVGTMDGFFEANPSTDSPNDAGTHCYVTENGPPGGDANTHDVDTTQPRLVSPLLDLTGFKRARLDYDVWFYNSATVPFENMGSTTTYAGPPEKRVSYALLTEYSTTGAWAPRQLDLTRWVPMVEGVRVQFVALDQDQTMCQGCADDVVEMGVDNVRVEGSRQVCLDPGVEHPPAGIGDSLRLTRTGGVHLAWTASATGPTHDPAAYYRLHVSSAPGSGFAVTDTTTATHLDRVSAAPVEYYLVSAVNAAGTSGDEPTP